MKIMEPVDTVAEQEEWCAGQCQAQGHCCNDPSTGSNQMISCAQACMMRASGEKMVDMLSDHDGICDRRGSSGCDLDVGGRSYSFCQTCDDLQDHCPHGVQSSSECDFGASLEPPLLPVDTVAEQEEWCAGQCQAQGYCCNDPSTGSNQIISCAQACMMRASGEKMVDMLSDHDGICDRTGR